MEGVNIPKEDENKILHISLPVGKDNVLMATDSLESLGMKLTSKDELAAWIPKLKEMSQSADVYGYFNNHYYGYAPENCIDVLEMLGVATPEQKDMRQHISGYWKSRITTKVITKTLSDYLAQEKKGIATLLSECMVYIDLEKRFILHDCADWQRTARERRFCKHIGALMLALPEDMARSVLERIRMHQWEFSQYTGEGRFIS